MWWSLNEISLPLHKNGKGCLEILKNWITRLFNNDSIVTNTHFIKAWIISLPWNVIKTNDWLLIISISGWKLNALSTKKLHMNWVNNTTKNTNISKWATANIKDVNQCRWRNWEVNERVHLIIKKNFLKRWVLGPDKETGVMYSGSGADRYAKPSMKTTVVQCGNLVINDS